MNKPSKKLIELIDLNKSANEICDILNINHKQLYDWLLTLKNNGFNFNRKYYSDGNIKYEPIYDLNYEIDDIYYTEENNIITDQSETYIKMLAISDLHFGNEFERIDLLDKIFNYAILKNIHIILCGGDLIDGTFSKGSQKIKQTDKQIEHFINDYPFDSNILTFAVAGDHDYSALNKCNQNILESIYNYRHDIIVGDFNLSKVNIKNDSIVLFHDIKNYRHSNNSKIVLKGHHHRYLTKFDNNQLIVCIPTLSNINTTFPTFLELLFDFEKGYINNIDIKQLCFNDKIEILSEINYNSLRNRNFDIKPIVENEEVFLTNHDYIKKLQK